MMLEELEYKLLKEPTHDVRELLLATVYGTKGGLRLRHFDTSWKLDELIAPDYHVLYDGKNLVGVVVYSNRKASFGGAEMNAFYIRYFSVSPAYQNKGVAQYLTSVAVKFYREMLNESSVFYAFIEAKNFKSQAVSDHFEPLSKGDFSPIYVSRFFPKKKEAVVADKRSFHKYYPSDTKVNGLYQGRSEKNAHYYILERDGKYAAVRCYSISWEVINYPNNNWMMMNFLPKIPILKKLVEGASLNFVAVDALSWNSDELLLDVFEHALADLKLSKLMVYADNSDRRFERLRSHADLGAISKLQKPPKVGILLFFHKCSEDLKQKIASSPVEIRGFDVT